MKKLSLTLAVIVIAVMASTASYGQTINHTIAKARVAAQDCISDAELHGLQIVELNTLTQCDDGTYSGTVTFYGRGRCPKNDYTACDPVFIPVATVNVSCGDVIDQVTCYQF